jgi:hypothetical protein
MEAATMYHVEGKVTLLRVLDLSTSPPWGAPGDELTSSEAVVKISGDPDKAFGIDLKTSDPEFAARSAMLAVLRDAYVHQLDVSVGFMEEPTGNRHSFQLARVQWGS